MRHIYDIQPSRGARCKRRFFASPRQVYKAAQPHLACILFHFTSASSLTSIQHSQATLPKKQTTEMDDEHSHYSLEANAINNPHINADVATTPSTFFTVTSNEAAYGSSTVDAALAEYPSDHSTKDNEEMTQAHHASAPSDLPDECIYLAETKYSDDEWDEIVQILFVEDAADSTECFLAAQVESDPMDPCPDYRAGDKWTHVISTIKKDLELRREYFEENGLQTTRSDGRPYYLVNDFEVTKFVGSGKTATIDIQWRPCLKSGIESDPMIPIGDYKGIEGIQLDWEKKE